MQPERMRVYQAAEELVAEVDRLVPLIAPLNPDAADHLQRSAESVLYNTGEGIEAWRPKVKVAVYEIARREANEVRAVLRRLIIQKVLKQEETRRAYNLAGAIIGMLTNASRTIENQKR